MTIVEAIILGLIQGLTEFLPVSSSGHIEIGKAMLGVEAKEDLTFTVVVHGATVLSTIVVFRKDIWNLIKDLFNFKWTEEKQFIAKILLSMLPVLVVGLFFKDYLEETFYGSVLIVGFMLLATGLLLLFTYYKKDTSGKLTYKNSFIIGLAQAIAVLPGISRSGATISTGLLAGVNKTDVTRFSFLMVLLPIIGANILDLLSEDFNKEGTSIEVLAIGFIAAFVSGLAACRWMINIIKKGKLIYFAIYCFIVGAIAIIAGI